VKGGKTSGPSSFRSNDLYEQAQIIDWVSEVPDATQKLQVAGTSVFVYVALAPMGDISLQPYPAVLAWIERIKKLPGLVAIPELDE